MEVDPLSFASAARALGAAAQGVGAIVPGFRSPPRVAGVGRTLRRQPDGSAIVAVRTRGRPWLAVLADMVDGVVAANRLEGAAADRCRGALWTALEQADLASGSAPRRDRPRAPRLAHGVPPPSRAAA
jgi:hypothetical protein